MRNIPIVILIALISVKGIAQNEEKSLIYNKGVQVSILNDSFPHVEPHMAVHPKQSNYLICASMMYTSSGVADRIITYHSEDGGETWQIGNFEEGTINGVDPWLTYDESGNVYLVYLPGIVHVSNNNGKSWTKGVKISGNPKQPYDFIKINSSKNFIFISASQSIRDSHKNLVAPISIIRATKDLGSFEEPIQILPGNFDYQIGVPVVLPATDTLLIPFYELTDINGDILDYNRIWISTVYDSSNIFSTPQWTGFVGGMPSLAFNSAYSGRIHLFWYKRVTANKNWIMQSSYSDDLGIHWTKSVGVEDFDKHEGDFGIQPAVAIADNGLVAVIWPDHRTDSTNKEYGVYFSYSSNSGETYSKSQLISQISSPFTKGNEIIIKNSNRSVANRFDMGGDYYGIVSLGKNKFQALWSDNRTGTLQLWTLKIEIEEKLWPTKNKRH